MSTKRTPEAMPVTLKIKLDEPLVRAKQNADYNTLENQWENEGGSVIPEYSDLQIPKLPLNKGELYKVIDQTLRIDNGEYICVATLEPVEESRHDKLPANQLP